MALSVCGGRVRSRWVNVTTSHRQLPAPPPTFTPPQWAPHRGGDYLLLATSQADVIAAQSLRYGVFAPEMGARTPGQPGLDADEFDDLCDHLIVWHRSPGQPVEAVGTCRLFPPHRNDRHPRGAGLWADRVFGLMPLEPILDRTVEVGRACVRSDHRGGPAISMLWRGIGSYLALTGNRYLLGCASIDLHDGGRSAASLWDLVKDHLAPPIRRCRPRDPVPIDRWSAPRNPTIPPLLAGYLRVGAQVCGPPGYDELSGAANFLLLLDAGAADLTRLRRSAPTGG